MYVEVTSKPENRKTITTDLFTVVSTDIHFPFDPQTEYKIIIEEVKKFDRPEFPSDRS